MTNRRNEVQPWKTISETPETGGKGEAANPDTWLEFNITSTLMWLVRLVENKRDIS